MADVRSLRGKAAIVGIGELAPMKTPDHRDGFQLMVDAIKLALEDAEMEPGEIDGHLLGVPSANRGQMGFSAYLAEYFERPVRYADVVDIAGASAAGMVWRAAAAISAGLCETVLCVTGEAVRPRRRGLAIGPHVEEFEQPHGPMAANSGFALLAQRHAYEYGTTARQRARIAVDQRTNALANPKAVFYGQPITVEDVLNSRVICDPLHMLEIVRPCSGAAAVIVTSAERARHAEKTPALLLGAGECIARDNLSYARPMTTTPVAVSAPAAFAMAGVTPRDIDLVSVYDCYTIMVMVTLEDAGFCKKGQVGKFVEEHDLTYKGDLPVNTHGGQMSFGQAGLAGGMSHITEAVVQLRGEAGERQIKSCELAFINGNGGAAGLETSLVLGR